MNDSCKDERANPNFLSYYEELKRYCYFLSKNKWDGDDLLQDVIVKTLKHYRNQKEIRPSLLKKMAYNHWIDKVRKRSFEIVDEIEEIRQEMNNGNTACEQVEILFQQLTLKQATIFVLKEVFLFQIKEISLLMETSEPAVKSALFRAKKRLSHQTEEGSPVHHITEDEEERLLLIETIQYCLTEQDPELLISRIPFIRSLATEASVAKVHDTFNKHFISPTLKMAA